MLALGQHLIPTQILVSSTSMTIERLKARTP